MYPYCCYCVSEVEGNLMGNLRIDEGRGFSILELTLDPGRYSIYAKNEGLSIMPVLFWSRSGLIIASEHIQPGGKVVSEVTVEYSGRYDLQITCVNLNCSGFVNLYKLD